MSIIKFSSVKTKRVSFSHGNFLPCKDISITDLYTLYVCEIITTIVVVLLTISALFTVKMTSEDIIHFLYLYRVQILFICSLVVIDVCYGVCFVVLTTYFRENITAYTATIFLRRLVMILFCTVLWLCLIFAALYNSEFWSVNLFTVSIVIAFSLPIIVCAALIVYAEYTLLNVYTTRATVENV